MPCQKTRRSMIADDGHTSEQQRQRLLKGEIIVELDWLEHDRTGVRSSICIHASPDAVWKTISDYDRLDQTLPKVIESHEVERRDSTVTIEQTGRTGILIFERTVHFVLQATEEDRRRISFHQIEGDFDTYEGEWLIEPLAEPACCLLHYRAVIKPAFFAPAILVSFVQRQDLPGILGAHKKQAELLMKSS
ncbi:MAG: SRPBCC family protein [Prosthecochloris sp.]|nr:SRPBCC family protein [Prosthecochloris sp.]